MSASAGFLARIDKRYAAADRAVLRYRNLVCFSSDPEEDERIRERLATTSLGEGMRIFPLLEYRGVAIDVLDLSSRMHSRTFKSLDGCVTIAHCLARGIGRIAFESGGNTASALTIYASPMRATRGSSPFASSPLRTSASSIATLSRRRVAG